MTSEPTVYIGDGVYAEFNGYDVQLRTNREDGKHFLHLERDAVQHLVRFLRDKGWEIR